MKKKGVLSVAIILMLTLTFGCVFAESKILVQYSAEKGKVEIKGSFDNLKNVNAGLMILPENINRENLTAEGIIAGKYLMDAVWINNDGSFVKSVILPDAATGGNYKIYLNYGETVLEEKLLYVNTSDADEIVRNLYYKTGQEYTSYYAENAEKLGIGTVEFNQYKNTISEIMQKRRIINTTEFLQEQNRTLALCRIMNSITDDTVLKFEEYFEIDYEKEFKNLSDNVKQSFVQYVKGEDKLNKAGMDVFWNSYIMGNIQNAENYTKLQKMILDFKDKINLNNETKLNLSDYNSLSDYYKSQVFYEVYDIGIEKYENIVSLFNTAVKNAKEKSGNDGESGITPDDGVDGGTGGGAGGGAGGGINGGKDEASDITTSEISIGKPQTEKTGPSDVSGHWAEQTIFSLYKKGVINGFEDNTYRPENKVTRAEFIKIMTKILDLPISDVTSFKDVNKEDWYYEQVSAAEAAGLILGSGGKFNPNENITRQDAAVIILRALEKKEISLTGEASFDDESLISDYAKDAVSKLGGSKIIQGFDGMFNPVSDTSRAEVAVLAERIIKMFER